MGADQFPLLAVSIILYNVLALGGAAATGTEAQVFFARGVDFHMFSGDIWRLSIGDLLMLVSLALLFVEVLKSTSSGAEQVLNHAMSMAVFIIALMEFLLVPGFSTTTFFFIVAMTVFDVVAGFTISIVAAKRDLGTAGSLIGTN